jgi:hypothetical protein
VQFQLKAVAANCHFFSRLNLDVTWSETGDRYMLKLFRDYLLHSVTEDGR